MKIFISHSSRDKWIAGKIAKDIEAFSIETFLDEKDLEVGDDLDDIVDVHLQTCDELLILLSPSSVASPWVLVEIGGAKALGKRIAPILLHLGANDIPSPITKKLALDINNIERYYDQLKARKVGLAPPKRSAARRSLNIKVGDVVKFPTQPPADYETPEVYVTWENDDCKLLGETAMVVDVDQDDGTFKVDIDGASNWFAPTWVSKVSDKEKKKKGAE
jgi:hypothetical protein